MIGSLGLPELIFILVLALLIFGPKRLPEIGRTVGKGLAEFRKASNDLKRTINTELALDEEPQPTTRPQRFEGVRITPAPVEPEDEPAPHQPGAQETLGALEAAPPNTEARSLAPGAVPLDEGAASPAVSTVSAAASASSVPAAEVAVAAAEVDPQAVSSRPLEPS